MAASNQRDETAVYSILLIILLLGLLGNVLSFIVWIKAATHRGSSSSGSHGNARLFAVLSLSDALSIVSFVVAYALKLGADSTSTCDSHVFIFIAAVFTFYSDYITIVIGLQRLVAVLRPFSLGRVCSAGRQWAAVGGVFILNLLLRALFGMWTIETHNFCSDSDTWLFTNVTELSQFSKDVAFVYMGIELFPLALLLSVNGILLRFLWSARQVPVRRPSVSSMKKEESGKRRNTQLIVAVSVPPILKCLMIQIVNIVLIVDDFNVPVGLRYCKEVAIVLSVSVNVLFYSYFGDRFRKKLREMWETLVHSRSVCSEKRLRRGSCSKSATTSVSTTEGL